MLVHQIVNEAAVDSIKLLSAVSDMILDLLPSTLPKGKRVTVIGKDILPSELNKLKNEFERYSAHVDYLTTKTSYVFINEDEWVNVNTGGTHRNTFYGSEITVNVSGFFDEARDISKKELITRRPSAKSLQSIRSILVHEMRHAIQSIEFRKYFDDVATREMDYRVDPREIDAAWLHHLHDNSPTDYKSGKEFADAIMRTFGSYKSLSEKWRKHYWRKSVRYWLDVTSKSSDPTPDVGTRNVEKMNKMIEPVITVVSSVGPSITDLREFGISGDGFLLRGDRFTAVTREVITSEKRDVHISNIAAIYGFIALVNKVSPVDVDAVNRFFVWKFGKSYRDAVTYIEDNGFGKFDKEFFIDLIQQTYQ